MALKGHYSLPTILFFLHNAFVKYILKFQTVLGTLRQFSEVLNASRKSQTFLESLNHFSKVFNSSLKTLFYEFLTLKNDLVLHWWGCSREISNSSWKSSTVIGSLKQFLELSDNTLGIRKVATE